MIEGFLKYPSPLLIIDTSEISPTVYVFAPEVTLYVFAIPVTWTMNPEPPVSVLSTVAKVFNWYPCPRVFTFNALIGDSLIEITFACASEPSPVIVITSPSSYPEPPSITLTWDTIPNKFVNKFVNKWYNYKNYKYSEW